MFILLNGLVNGMAHMFQNSVSETFKMCIREMKETVISKNTKGIMISTNVNFPEDSGTVLNILGKVKVMQNLLFSE